MLEYTVCVGYKPLNDSQSFF